MMVFRRATSNPDKYCMK